MEQNLNRYQIFYEVAKSGSISNAAKSLYISQPAISKSISKLEYDLQTKLFLRKSRGVSITNEGAVLFEQVKTAIEAINLGEKKLKQINDLGVGHIRIGTSATFCKYLLMPILKGFIEKYPHIKITIESQSTSHTLKLLEREEIDVALVVKLENQDNLIFDPLGEFQDVFVATKTYLDNLNLRESSTEISKKKFDAELFECGNIMLLDEENITRLYVDNYFKENNIEIKQVLEVNNMDLLIDFARIGMGVACVIKEFVLDDLASGSLVEIPLNTPIKKRTAGFAFAKNIQFSDSMKKFIEFYGGGE
ncbi:MAG: LysR family transcriptional regulator [Oscillospiraceae bacterium]